MPQSMLLCLLSAVKNSTQHRNYCLSNLPIIQLCKDLLAQKYKVIFGSNLTRYCLTAIEILEQFS